MPRTRPPAPYLILRRWKSADARAAVVALVKSGLETIIEKRDLTITRGAGSMERFPASFRVHLGFRDRAERGRNPTLLDDRFHSRRTRLRTIRSGSA